MAYQTVAAENLPLSIPFMTSYRSDATHSALIIGSELLGVGAGFVVPIGWLTVRAMRRATYGYPDIELIASGAGALVAAATLGFLAGRLFRSWLVPPLVGVGIWSGIWLLSSNRQFALLSPLLDLEPSPMQPFAMEVGLMQCVWFLTLGAALFGAGLLWKNWNRVLAIATLASLSAAALSAVGLARLGPLPYTSDSPEAPLQCVESRELEVCWHPAYAALLPEMAEAISSVAQPLIEATGTPSRAVGVLNFDQILSGRKADPRLYPFRAGVIGSRFEAEVFRRQAARDLVGYGYCVGLEQDPVRDGLAAWLLAQSIGDPEGIVLEKGVATAVYRWLTQANTEERNNWIAGNLPILQSCGEATPPPGVSDADD